MLNGNQIGPRSKPKTHTNTHSLSNNNSHLRNVCSESEREQNPFTMKHTQTEHRHMHTQTPHISNNKVQLMVINQVAKWGEGGVKRLTVALLFR